MAFQAEFQYDGDRIPHTPSGALAAGDVVPFKTTAGFVGIATEAIAASALGSLAIKGVFKMAKAAEAIDAGIVVYWDDSNNNITATSTGNTLVGKSVTTQVSGDAYIWVALQ